MLWMTINVILFITTYMNYGTSKKYTYLRVIVKGGLPYARGAAMVLNFNCMLVLLSMCRNIISLIRSNLTSVVHVCGHCFNLTNLTESFSQDVSKLEQRLSQLDDPWINPIRESGLDPVTALFKTVAGVSGVIMTMSLILMVSSATDLIRRSYFETFWFTHHLFIVFFACLVVHGTGNLLRYQTNMNEHDPEICKDLKLWENHTHPCYLIRPQFATSAAMTWKFVIFPIILYCLERLLRIFRSFQKVKILKVIKHPSKVLEIQMKKEGFSCEAGQYIFIKCPRISKLEWHPFTLTSVRVHFLGRTQYNGEDVFKYDVIMCIGAGIGVTPFASILKSVWYRHNQGVDDLKIKKVYFFWICRDTNAFEWFTDLLRHLEIQMTQMKKPDFVECNIYLTGWDNKLAIESALHQGAEDNITHLKARTNYGRPKWDDIFKNIAGNHKGREIGVFFCGPSVLSHVLHKMSNQHSNPATGVKFCYNKENF
ncbi:PREDICTED: cytochrome b-245 heavy chain-like [Acropora digitifera]|uniref:cytochrome b-245 heavy chain-like n=1 Tax=Acropora digitifera TaxID=70779 RepID=UPI00077AC976|nr:PREDICTED: cytochrome b-245 heavy chain-like [Acropora digitifera]